MGLYEYVMSNPYSSTSNNFFYKNDESGIDFSILNNFQTIASSDEVWNYQRQELYNLQQSVTSNKHAALNSMIQSGEMNTGPADYQVEQEQIMDQTIADIYESIDGIRRLQTKEGSIEAGKNALQQRNELIRKLGAALKEVKEKANIDSPVYDADITQIENMIKALDTTGSLRGWKAFIKNINRFQGETLEEIGVAWFNQRVPKDIHMEAVSTGKVYYSGTSAAPKGSMQQDILVFNMDKVDLMKDMQISYSIGGQTKTCSFEEFCNLLKTYAGSEQISIDDAAYDMLMDASELGIQAKSGKNQLPWNKNKSNKISISDFGNDGKNPSIKKTFILLQELKTLCSRVNDTSEQYDLMANYGLATCFSKFLHLSSQNGNQYLLTRKGFMTYYDRIMELHNQFGSIFTISGNGIQMNDNTISEKHNVSFFAGR